MLLRQALQHFFPGARTGRAGKAVRGANRTKKTEKAFQRYAAAFGDFGCPRRQPRYPITSAWSKSFKERRPSRAGNLPTNEDTDNLLSPARAAIP